MPSRNRASSPSVTGRRPSKLRIEWRSRSAVATGDAKPLDALLASRNYRDVYAALQQPASAASRVFFIDAGCDGLQEDGENVDVMYERGTSQVLFDGKPEKQKLSRAAYSEKLAQSDERYGQLLAALAASIQASANGSTR